ncbi:MAG TPA: Flp family type IVb pilin [Pirellulales bacterium]|nr:Flp family type IVb pilin [Pirellulales bacterium]
MSFVNRLIKSEEAATAVEYAFMLALILMAVIATVATLGTNTSTLFNSSKKSLDNVGFGS